MGFFACYGHTVYSSQEKRPRRSVLNLFHKRSRNLALQNSFKDVEHKADQEIALSENEHESREKFYTCEDLDSIDLLKDIAAQPSDGPVVLKARHGLKQDIRDSELNRENLPFNDGAPIEFETDLFKGKVFFRFKHCPNEDKEYFKGRRRKQQYVVQGRFKHKMKCGEVVSGYQVFKPLKNIPPKLIVKASMRLIRNLAPTMKDDLFNDAPHIFNPILQTIQTLDVSFPGNEPDVKEREIEENNSLMFDSAFNEKMAENESKGRIRSLSDMLLNSLHLHGSKHHAKSKHQRKKYFSHLQNGDFHYFSPDLVYTFEFYEDKLDVSTFRLILPFFTYDICKIITDQPIPFMSRVIGSDNPEIEGKYLFAFDLYHEEQLKMRACSQDERQDSMSLA